MFDPTSLWLFVASALALLLTPGPAVLYIVARSLEQGRSAGFVSTLGICLGGFVHVIAAAIGLSALLMTSAAAFSIVRYAGAAYLVWLGIRALASRGDVDERIEPEPEPFSRIFRQAIVVQILNPKTALFFLAFLPQFVDTTRGDVTAQIVGYGLLFQMIALCTDGGFALLAGTLGAWLRGRRDIRRTQRTVSGITYIALGAIAALTGESR